MCKWRAKLQTSERHFQNYITHGSVDFDIAIIDKFTNIST